MSVEKGLDPRSWLKQPRCILFTFVWSQQLACMLDAHDTASITWHLAHDLLEGNLKSYSVCLQVQCQQGRAESLAWYCRLPCDHALRWVLLQPRAMSPTRWSSPGPSHLASWQDVQCHGPNGKRHAASDPAGETKLAECMQDIHVSICKIKASHAKDWGRCCPAFPFLFPFLDKLDDYILLPHSIQVYTQRYLRKNIFCFRNKQIIFWWLEAFLEHHVLWCLWSHNKQVLTGDTCDSVDMQPVLLPISKMQGFSAR